MAQSIVNLSAAKHAVAGSSNLTATKGVGGEGCINIKITADHDNGVIVGKGANVTGEIYAEAVATTFTGKIRHEKASNGNFYVDVLTAVNAYFLLAVPMNTYEFNSIIKADSAFYNANGDVVRSYPLFPGDTFELSAVGFSGTPVIDAAVTVDATTKQVKISA